MKSPFLGLVYLAGKKSMRFTLNAFLSALKMTTSGK
jgi:hypothetical protein